MKNNIIQRLKKLEQRMPDKMSVLIEINGEQKECSVDELDQYPNAGFVKVIYGNNLLDLDEILDWVNRMANE